MDDEAALIARRVALAAAAWFNAPSDVEAYQGLSVAVGEWNAYCAPVLEESGEELLDDLAETSPPVPLGQGLADLEAALRRQARRGL